MVDVLRGLMAGGWFEYHGEILQLERCKICPTPDDADPAARSAATPTSRCAAPRARATAGSTRAAIPPSSAT